jgi:type III secretion protein C
MRLRKAGFAAVLLAVCCGAPVLQSAPVPWKSGTFSYLAQSKPLDDLIREFAASQGLTAVVAENVEGTVNGRFNLTPSSFLELMSSAFGLHWYYDGTALYVYAAGDIRSSIIRLRAANTEKLNTALKRLSIADKRYPINYDRRQNTAMVSGPPRFIELVEQTARSIDQPEPTRNTADIRVFPLRYAWAADRTITQGGREQRLLGVASVLRSLYSPDVLPRDNPPPPQINGADSSRTSQLNRMRGMGYYRDEQLPPLPSVEPNASNVSSTPTPSALGLPQFQPDSRLNAVIVRDRPERMAFYESVIHALDVKPGLVEIEAKILEVRSDAISSLGIDWRLHSGDVDIQLSRSALPNLGFGTAIDERSPRSRPGRGGGRRIGDNRGGGGRLPDPGIVPPVPPSNLQRGGVLTTVLGDSGRYLIARVNALAQEGKANILASPSVLTLDNVEAVLENIDTFFVRVTGNLDAALFDVSSGTSLWVTPLIVNEGGRTQVKLAIRIEDGNITDQSVDQIPVIQRSTIGTQAFITEGQSLLIGGYRSNSQRDTSVGVPGLSSVPVVGRLFKYSEKQNTEVQRLFLLTPRVVEP